MRVTPASQKIKALTKDAHATVEKRVATISVSTSAMKNSPTKY